MLRITQVAESECQVTLRLEGRIVTQWSLVLERECNSLLDQEKQILLDFADVTIVDERGAETLANLKTKGIRIINASKVITDWLAALDAG